MVNYLGEYHGGVGGGAIWHLEGNGNDSSVNGWNPLETNNMAFGLSYGRFGQGALFNGSNSDIRYPNNLYQATDANYTILAFVKPSEARTQTIYAYYTYFDAANQHGIKFKINSSNKLYLFHRNNNPGQDASVTGTIDVPINVWTFVACRCNGTNLSLFVNGKLDTSTACNFYANYNGSWGGSFIGVTRLAPSPT